MARGRSAFALEMLEERVGPNGELRQDLILNSIRAGGYPHVAAEAWGVPAEVFEAWLRRGAARRAQAKYRQWATRVRQAVAQARLKAELAIFTESPRMWLLSGPGKETKDRRGWSTPQKPLIVDQRQVNIQASPEWQGLWATILAALQAFPEARAALVGALRQGEARALPKPGGEVIEGG